MFGEKKLASKFMLSDCRIIEKLACLRSVQWIWIDHPGDYASKVGGKNFKEIKFNFLKRPTFNVLLIDHPIANFVPEDSIVWQIQIGGQLENCHAQTEDVCRLCWFVIEHLGSQIFAVAFRNVPWIVLKIKMYNISPNKKPC